MGARAPVPTADVLGGLVCAQVGTQVWTAESLDVDVAGVVRAQEAGEWEAAARDGTPAWCYHEATERNGQRWGRLYNAAALAKRKNRLCSLHADFSGRTRGSLRWSDAYLGGNLFTGRSGRFRPTCSPRGAGTWSGDYCGDDATRG